MVSGPYYPASDDDDERDPLEQIFEEWEEEASAFGPDAQVLGVWVSGFEQSDVQELADAIQRLIHSMEEAGTPRHRPLVFHGIVQRHY